MLQYLLGNCCLSLQGSLIFDGIFFIPFFVSSLFYCLDFKMLEFLKFILFLPS